MSENFSIIPQFSEKERQEILKELVANEDKYASCHNQIKEYYMFSEIIKQLDKKLRTLKYQQYMKESPYFKENLKEAKRLFKDIYEFMKENLQHSEDSEERYILIKFLVIEDERPESIFTFSKFLEQNLDYCTSEDLLYLLYFMKGCVSIFEKSPDLIFDVPCSIKKIKDKLINDGEQKTNQGDEIKSLLEWIEKEFKQFENIQFIE